MIWRRLRGLAGLAATWAVAWTSVASLLLLGVNAAGVEMARPLIVALLMEAFGQGAISGILFGAVVIVAERRRTLAALSAGRFVLWGLAGGTILSLVGLTAVDASFWIASGVFGGLMGMATAALTLRMARRPTGIAASGASGGAVPELSR